MTISAALNPQEMGPVVATRTMMRARPDGVEDTITIEVGVPQEQTGNAGQSLWTCTLRISVVPRIMAAVGASSLDAIINATYMAATVLKQQTFASEIDMSLLPYFGLPVSPITTTPEALAQEQNRPKAIQAVPISSAAIQPPP